MLFHLGISTWPAPHMLTSSMALQMGKLHFGVLLGWSTVCSIAVWFVTNNLGGYESSESKALDLYSCCCVFGYGMTPMLLYSLFSLLLPKYAHSHFPPPSLTAACIHPHIRPEA